MGTRILNPHTQRRSERTRPVRKRVAVGSGGMSLWVGSCPHLPRILEVRSGPEREIEKRKTLPFYIQLLWTINQLKTNSTGLERCDEQRRSN